MATYNWDEKMGVLNGKPLSRLEWRVFNVLQQAKDEGRVTTLQELEEAIVHHNMTTDGHSWLPTGQLYVLIYKLRSYLSAGAIAQGEYLKGSEVIANRRGIGYSLTLDRALP